MGRTRLRRENMGFPGTFSLEPLETTYIFNDAFPPQFSLYFCLQFLHSSSLNGVVFVDVSHS